MKTRTLFGHPVRWTTLEFHRHKIDIDAFVRLMDPAGFATNMKMYPDQLEKLYPEEWVEKFLSWSEIEEEYKEDKL